ncbi:hypothetical protein CWS72_18990 [Telmatospirillum siberiense]|uniref:Uncharacterized protein n=1 Tax=Telmatospirillum siberiense TaxID=382514 RepID=A0A2N3PRB9_9PROT|nr:hypothetical protein CWS72_18990 [Telmatospirillum siberiense]
MELKNPHAATLKGRVGELVEVLDAVKHFGSANNVSQSTVLALHDPLVQPPLKFSLGSNMPLMSFHPQRLKTLLIGPDISASEFCKFLPQPGKEGKAVWGGIDPMTFPSEQAKGAVTEAMFRMLCTALRILAIPIKYRGDNGIDSFSIVPIKGKIFFASVDCKQKETWQPLNLHRPEGTYERLASFLDRGMHANMPSDFALLIEFSALCLWSLAEDKIPEGSFPAAFFGGFAVPKTGPRSGMNLKLLRRANAGKNGVKDRPINDEVMVRFPLTRAINALKILLIILANLEWDLETKGINRMNEIYNMTCGDIKSATYFQWTRFLHEVRHGNAVRYFLNKHRRSSFRL